MGSITSQITSLTIVYSIVHSDADQRKHQSSASLAFVRGIHRVPVNSPHKWPVTRKMLPFDDVMCDEYFPFSAVYIVVFIQLFCEMAFSKVSITAPVSTSYRRITVCFFLLSLAVLMPLLFVEKLLLDITIFPQMKRIETFQQQSPNNKTAQIGNIPTREMTGSPPQTVQFNETRVIIYAKYRTGSTYASEFFVKHNESFFVFEPLMSRYINVDSGTPVNLPTTVLKEVFQCNIVNSTYRNLMRDAQLKYEIFCHPDVNQPACDKSSSLVQSLSRAELVCKKSKFKVIKVIRVNHLRDLERFMAEGVKVIHLIRDPRGVIASQDRHILQCSKKFKQDYYPERVDNFCQTGLDDLNFIDSYAHKKNYHLVRYEDLAFFPVEEGHLLYEYIDIKLSPDVLDWMKNISPGNKLPWKGQRVKRIKDLYTTKRANSAFASQAWRERITNTKLHVIQGLCRDFMNKTGYTPLTFETVKNYSIPALRSIYPGRLRKYTPTD